MELNKNRDPQSYAVIGAAMEVHNELGPGFLEAVYQEAMEIEMGIRNIPYLSQPKANLFYKGAEMAKYYMPDFICFENLVVEIKAEKKLTNIDDSQILNLLKSTKFKVGLLINFCEESLVFRRFVN